MANVIMSILSLLLGAVWIWCAVTDFKKERYPSFALDIMLTVYQSACMVYHIIMGLMA